jgi:hypothetical protein
VARSRYDELHDRFAAASTSKAGSRYERLAAIVLKVLHQQQTVIHDLRLLGESEVKHQIDVTIEAHGRTKRVLVECKDFDVSGDRVGLGIIRDFYGVFSDVHPDEAFVITCNDFTADARKFAAAKGIKLAILREAVVPEGYVRVRDVEMSVSMLVPEIRSTRFMLAGDEETGRRLQEDRAAAGLDLSRTTQADPVFMNLPTGERVQVVEYLNFHLNHDVEKEAGFYKKVIPMAGATLEVEERGGVPLASIVLGYELRETESVVIGWANQVASLILTGLGEADFVIFEDDLRRFTIAEAGEVVELLATRPFSRSGRADARSMTTGPW